jgi:hypothetical protein
VTKIFLCTFVNSGAGFDDEKSLLMSQMSLEKRFGQSAVFGASTLMENGGVPQSATPETLLKEAIHVISCGYEDKTDWGSEVCLFLLFIALTSIWALSVVFANSSICTFEQIYVFREFEDRDLMFLG